MRSPARMRHTDVPDEINTITADIVDAALAVHRSFGPGLTETTYVTVLRIELEARGRKVLREVVVPLRWRGRTLEEKLRVDLVVDGVPVEVKATEGSPAIHRAQLRTYVRLLGAPVGLLINFNCVLLKSGIDRVVNDAASVPPSSESPSIDSGGLARSGGDDDTCASGGRVEDQSLARRSSTTA